ncbi:MAG: HEPN domain-containing protein [bacterium]
MKDQTMRDRNRELALQWLKKADHDLITARQTLALPDGPTDTPCFHAQQAVEKALKGYTDFSSDCFPQDS